MLTIQQFEKIVGFRMARSIFGRGIYYTAAYFVDGLMIDTGCAHTVDELMECLDGRKINLIVNTHSHEDHIAANALLQSTTGAEVLAHPLALPYLADPRQWQLRPYQTILWGLPKPSKANSIDDVVETEKHQFHVIHTPGHSPDHICLYEPIHGWLFTGDVYVGGKDRALRRDYNVWQIIDSLKNLQSLEPSTIFTGSGNVKKDATNVLRDKIKYLEKLGENVMELHTRGWNNHRIRRHLLGPEMFIRYITLGHFSGLNLVRSYIEDKSTDLTDNLGGSQP